MDRQPNFLGFLLLPSLSRAAAVGGRGNVCVVVVVV